MHNLLLAILADPPYPPEPGNDPLLTVIATVIFVVVSLGGGMLAFKLNNRKPRQ